VIVVCWLIGVHRRSSAAHNGFVVPIPTLPDDGNVLVCPFATMGRWNATITAVAIAGQRPRLAEDRLRLSALWLFSIM
jgi:hypothetical protein